MKRFLYSLAILALLTPLPAAAQRHLPGLEIFRSTVPFLLDTWVETPAVYNGHPSEPFPGVGEDAEFQVFVPEAANEEIFQYTIEFSHTVTDTFRIVSVKDWTGEELRPEPGSNGTARTTVRLQFSRLPASGHLLTVVLEPLRKIAHGLPLALHFSLTVVSTPPRRVWQMEGRQELRWN